MHQNEGAIMAQESRGFIGTMFKWMFILFNIFMAVLVYMSMGHTEESGTAVQVGAGMGIGMLAGMWIAGIMVLGAFAYFTRAKS
jgi:preprotein translocase subunit SecG